MKNVPAEFDDIRCYKDSEVKNAVDMLLKQNAIHEILTTIMGYDNARYLLDNMAPLHTIDDAQRELILVLFSALEHRTCKEVRLYGTENIDRLTGHIFISNHRDIVLDATFLNVHLFFNGFDTTHIGIGNNLLIYPWVECLMRLNKSFIVRRDGSIKEQLLISKHLSSYIRYVIEQNKEGVWLAQREGRAKDSSDHTQTSILKMLGMSSNEPLPAALRKLHIHPTAIHYEYDPCDFLKAREAQLKRDDSNYVKKPADDFLSMKTGLM
ncbi:MAG: 1-acyl-sn-glycerol-3-phosphate acyltransferase, partial [Paludibacteraceae bacterium]|nr:1-acyl-sn-glycerol-3-phosphate acyltransferase [Paludibacteraceae bacterium]